MLKEIELEGKGWARGRNGYFVPRKVEIFKDVRGEINLSVLSKQPGKTEPISLRISKTEAEKLAHHLLSMVDVKQEPVRIVAVMDGGVLQEILANKPGIQAIEVDYDTQGAETKEVKRVLQTGWDGRKFYETAYFGSWGEVKCEPGETRRFFRTALG